MNDARRLSVPHETRGGSSGYLLAVLPRGEALRNFVYSGVLQAVRERTQLRTLSVVPTEALRDRLEAQIGPIDPLVELPEPGSVRLARRMLDTVHGRWLWSEAAQERWRRRDLAADTFWRRAKRSGKNAIARSLAHGAGVEMLHGFERLMSRSSKPTAEFDAYLRRCRPTLVFNASHVHSRNALPVAHAARNLRIPTATFVFSWDNLTSQGRIFPTYDYYIVWSEAIRAQLLSIYPRVPPDRVFVTGTPQFDPHFRDQNVWSRRDFCARVGARPDRPIVLYTTSMPYHTPGEPLIVEGIANMLADLDAAPVPQLLVRVYPKDRTGRFEDLRARRPDILFQDVPWEPSWLTPLPEDTALWASTLRHVAVGINVASTVSLELCMFDKPVLNVGYNPAGKRVHAINYARYYHFDHYRPVHESGAAEIAWTEPEMRGLLNQALLAPERRASNRRRLLDAMFGETLDGKAGRRVADTLAWLSVNGEPA